ncbi:YidC/Oxa1 family membrane protein insertase [Treponema sp.]|uniref:YidC/Oxa1 family membrane protein insertase n=1 Tax=Treponema sp. TaxID=166 RepID=UPI003EFEFF56
MTSILYNIIISPIELVVEIVFEFMFGLVGLRQTNQGLAVIGVSLVISLLTLPLYHRADAVQQKQRDIQNAMSYWINHIKRTFKGDERFMMLQTYYRESGYSPLSALNGSISLLLEIPFFIAAYHFLSHLEVLNGAKFSIISDLGKADELIKIGSISLNLLPILMTTINCISAAIYLKGFPLKDKLQTYGMALIFLVLLYNSPSGLVVYWTCNNIFSLVKNIFYKLKNPKKILCFVCAILGTLFTVFMFSTGKVTSKKKLVFMIFFQTVALIPLVLYFFKKYANTTKKSETNIQNSKSSVLIFILAGVFLVILTGILIPSAVIASSPAEFVDLQNYRNPLLFLINSTCYAIGFFLLWAGIIRYMLPDNSKHIFDCLMWIIAGVFLIDYMCFGRSLGNLSSLLVFTDGLNISKLEKLINLCVVCILVIVLSVIFKYKKIIPFVISISTICIGIVSINQIHNAQKQLSDMAYIKEMKTESKVQPLFRLTKTGKNVIVFMLDKAISGYIPYLFEEKPELKDQFAGFTYYPNTLSHGFFTNFGTPELFGGYEYTPTEMNKRDNEPLVEKQNEALKVLPVLFYENDFEVTVIDPPYAGYTWIPDLSIYDDYPDIKKYIASGRLQNNELLFDSNSEALLQNNRNFFCYSIFKSIPLLFGSIFYSGGTYYNSVRIKNSGFIKEYSILTLLANLTEVSNEKKNTCLLIQNSTTHEPCLLQLPDYEMKPEINNTGYKTAADGHIKMETEIQQSHYHANMASLMALGKWFDYMRNNEVYDNTRIIIVADHGRGLGQFDNMLLKDPAIDVEWCNPLLLVKDFNSKDFTISNEFMTNADTPTLALEKLIQNPVNPFTGNAINNDEKTARPQIITSSGHWDTTKYNGTTFDTSDGHWYSVHDNIFREENWEMIE